MAGEEMQSCPEKLVATRRGESSRRCPLSPWRWLVAARAARSSQGNMEAHVGAGDCQGKGESSLCALFPLEVAGSRSAGPEQPGEYGGPCGSWWPPGEERAASRAKVLRFLPMGSVGQENS